MPLTCNDCEAQGLLAEIARLFDEKVSAGTFLSKCDVQAIDFPPFGEPNVRHWWQALCVALEQGGQGPGVIERCLRQAADMYPGNRLLSAFLDAKSQPDQRDGQGGSITIKLPATYSPDDVIRILEAAKKAALELGAPVVINLGQAGSSEFSLTVEGITSPEELQRVAERIEQALGERNYQARVQVEPYHFRDYYADPLTAEGPDGQRFGLDRIRASTTVKDVARGIMGAYADKNWPTSGGQPTQAVVNRVTPEGERHRLDPRDTLHDAGVRPGDVLNVSPERTAGVIDPNRREEALAKARNEVIDYLEGHPGFAFSANSEVAPTEYEFEFRAPSFGPPPSPGAPPTEIDSHRVFVELPPDFPEQAPVAWWQTEIFHPNVHPENGYVCLGALAEHYVPGMDFGDLCQLLVDLAAYRNYAVTEEDPTRPGQLRGAALDTQAAAWAASEQGQMAIERRGGISLLGRMVLAGAPERPLRIRRLDA